MKKILLAVIFVSIISKAFCDDSSTSSNNETQQTPNVVAKEVSATPIINEQESTPSPVKKKSKKVKTGEGYKGIPWGCRYEESGLSAGPVSYTHLTLPTI